jgi:hypothetical protein
MVVHIRVQKLSQLAVGFQQFVAVTNERSRLFADIVCAGHAKTMTDIERTHNVGAYLVAFVASIFVNYALAWLIGRLNAPSATCGLKIALVCWFAFLFVEYSTISVFSAFETNPWPLIYINMGRPFVAWAISGLVLGRWRKPA